MMTVTMTVPEWAVAVVALCMVGLSLTAIGLALWEKWELHVMRRTIRNDKEERTGRKG